MYPTPPIATVVAVVAALVIGVVLTYGVLRLVAESHKRNCIQDAEARYPALVVQVPERGLAPAHDRTVNIERRRAALDDCEASIF